MKIHKFELDLGNLEIGFRFVAVFAMDTTPEKGHGLHPPAGRKAQLCSFVCLFVWWRWKYSKQSPWLLGLPSGLRCRLSPASFSPLCVCQLWRSNAAQFSKGKAFASVAALEAVLGLVPQLSERRKRGPRRAKAFPRFA